MQGWAARSRLRERSAAQWLVGLQTFNRRSRMRPPTRQRRGFSASWRMIMAIGNRGCSVAIGAALALALMFGAGVRDANASTGCTAVTQGAWNISASNNQSNGAQGSFATGDSLSFTLDG